jgi:hypothetical protein
MSRRQSRRVAFSPDENPTARGEPLRAALTRLQELRGAA